MKMLLIDQEQIALLLCTDSAVPQLVFSREQVWRSKLDICVQKLPDWKFENHERLGMTTNYKKQDCDRR